MSTKQNRQRAAGGSDGAWGADPSDPTILQDPPPVNRRELEARQIVLAAGTLDTWRAKFEKYRTTRDDCDCPDRQFRGVECKHMLAWRMLAQERAL